MCYNHPMSPKYFLPILMVLVLAGAGCSLGKSNQSLSNQSASTTAVNGAKDDELAKDTALSNPATVYCLSQGGKFSMRKALDGSTEGYCELQNNIQCEEWAYYRGDCPSGAKQGKSATSTTETATSTTPMVQATSTDDGSSLVKEDDRESTQPEVEQGTNSKLEISAEVGEPGEIITSWKMNGLKSPGGFIVILSGKPGISDLGKYNHTTNNPDSRSFTWNNLVAGRTYYFKVCTNSEGRCGEMSNEVSAVAE